ncbi:MAG TPA: RNA polymerase sigma factor [Pyrinomonadaceae bacterium]|jgi:RNA polymerase sigma-70 factor (ECF subfamily)|nr:RNA polymerase sigma factor [Pyrinomonadaceae bacterium]
MTQARETLEKVFRDEYGRIIATLIRISGSFDLAEEALQEAFTAAVSKWEVEGSPNNPGAWLTTVAHRRLLDTLRRDRTRTDKQTELAYEANRLQPYVEAETLEDVVEYSDDRLRLIFTCCHPSLTREAQVALTLRTLGGLTTNEIAHAFLVPEPTLAQRLVRAKQKIRLAGIPYEIPSLERIADRLAAVRAVIYLIFNEGYAASTGQSLIRNDLCAEAIRLGRVLCELLPDEPENLGLLALMLLQDSRRDARVSELGELVTLEEQDRSRWNAAEIEEGLNLVQRALRLRRVGGYQLQAAIAAVHAEAKTADETDWRQIVALYEELMRITSSPIVALNHAAAVAMAAGFERGLDLIDAIGAEGALQNYYLFHASRADLLRRLGRFDEAKVAYTTALSLTTNRVEQNYIRRRLAETSL